MFNGYVKLPEGIRWYQVFFRRVFNGGWDLTEHIKTLVEQKWYNFTSKNLGDFLRGGICSQLTRGLNSMLNDVMGNKSPVLNPSETWWNMVKHGETWWNMVKHKTTRSWCMCHGTCRLFLVESADISRYLRESWVRISADICWSIWASVLILAVSADISRYHHFGWKNNPRWSMYGTFAKIYPINDPVL